MHGKRTGQTVTRQRLLLDMENGQIIIYFFTYRAKGSFSILGAGIHRGFPNRAVSRKCKQGWAWQYKRVTVSLANPFWSCVYMGKLKKGESVLSAARLMLSRADWTQCWVPGHRVQVLPTGHELLMCWREHRARLCSDVAQPTYQPPLLSSKSCETWQWPRGLLPAPLRPLRTQEKVTRKERTVGTLSNV